MKNRYMNRIDRLIKVSIEGSNVNSYLKRIIKREIYIVKLIPISYKETHVILRYSDYKKLLEVKSIYKITVIEMLGGKKIEENIKKNSILILFMIIGFFSIIFLSNVIFSIDVIHQDREIRKLIYSELNRYGIVKFSLKKKYNELEKIEDDILEDNKDRLEWIEISSYGTKYIVRIEERKLNDKEEEFKYQSIVSRKNAVLVRVDAIRGEKVKFVNDYVSKGDTVISGYITRPNGSTVMTMAKGVVYGEVWYQVDVDYPIVYQESNLTGKSKIVYVLYFLNNRLSLFDFDKYRSFEYKSKELFRDNILDVRFVKEEHFEEEVKDEVYTEDIAKIRAIDYIKNKLKKDNSNIVSISDVKILNTISDEDSIKFNLFVKVIEDIGEVSYIEDINKEENKNNS